MTVSLQRNGSLVALLAQPPSGPADGGLYIEALAAISSQQGPFVLLVDIRTEIDLTPEQRKAQNLWYKADREKIEAACLACALVRPAADDAMQHVWQGLFSFPLLVTSDRADADAFLTRYAPKEYADDHGR